LICLINQRIQVNFVVTSFQSAVNAEDKKLYGAQVATHRAKALQQQKESKTAQGQRFAAKSGKPQGQSFAVQSCKPQGQRINTYHYTYKLFKALLLCIWWSRALSLSIKKRAAVSLQNFTPLACKFVLQNFVPVACNFVPQSVAPVQFCFACAP
jgi:hypothetical protein